MAKRLFVAVLLFSGLAFGQALSGSWSTKISLLPPPVSLDSTEFTLQGKLFDWTVGGKAEFFGADGWVWQTFFAQGWIGPVHSDWTLLFGPLGPAFIFAFGKTSLTLSGIDLTFYSAYLGANVPPYVFLGGPSGGMVVEAKYDLNGIGLTLDVGFGARKQDITVVYTGVGEYSKVFPVCPFPGGFEFTELWLTAENVPFCCGISLDLTFVFDKEDGFDSLFVYIKNIPLCCGISFDVETQFTTTDKSVTIKPKWGGITGCFTVYGDVLIAPSYLGDIIVPGHGGTIGGIKIYGFKLRCDIGDCTYAEFLTALNTPKVEEILEEDIFQEPEFEYVKLGFCGAGCCGGQWNLDVALYFQPTGSLFGLSRVVLDASFPLMANLRVNLGLSAKVGEPAGLTAGWTFTF